LLSIEVRVFLDFEDSKETSLLFLLSFESSTLWTSIPSFYPELSFYFLFELWNLSLISNSNLFKMHFWAFLMWFWCWECLCLLIFWCVTLCSYANLSFSFLILNYFIRSCTMNLIFSSLLGINVCLLLLFCLILLRISLFIAVFTVLILTSCGFLRLSDLSSSVRDTPDKSLHDDENELVHDLQPELAASN